MAPGQRVDASQSAKRTNLAAELLRLGASVPEAARKLAKRFMLSERQARRYLVRAEEAGPVEIPPKKLVFTVKLSEDIARRLRTYARRSGHTLSSLVAQALDEFLGSRGAGPRGGR